MASGSAGELRAGPATYGGLFVVTLSTLMYEIVLTRIFSVTMWYHFAFVAISVALFGMTVGALIIHLRPGWFSDERVKHQMWRFSLLFAVSVAAAFVSELAIPFVPRASMAGVASVVLTCAIISVPFVCSGVVVCLALTRFPRRVNRLYGVDLLGAGLGCVLVVVLFRWLDGPSLVVAIAAIACLGAVLFGHEAGLRGGTVLAAVVLVALGGAALGNARLHNEGNPFIRILWTKESQDPLHSYDRWNAFSRVTVDGDPNKDTPPAGFGISPTIDRSIALPQLSMVIDSTAGTMLTRYTGDPRQTDFLRYDVTNLGYYAKEGQRFHSAVIGVGGGRDVLAGLEFGARKVTGIEINGNILHLVNHTLGDFTGHLDRNPRVHFVNDEARSYLTRTKDRYDVIQISLIDTWAATAAGAYALSENTLYTTQAWNTFFDRLKDGGILSVSRWYGHEDPGPLEIFRTAALAAHVLTDRGVENPRSHILIYEGPTKQFGASEATLLVSPQPFDRSTVRTIERHARQLEFKPVLTPTSAADPRFADLVAPGGPGKGIAEFKADISPPTDDRPFFFQMAKPSTFLRGEGFEDTQVFRPVLTLVALAGAVLLLALVCIGGPLTVMGRRTDHRDRAPFYVYFAGIGLGFMFVEFSQLQRLNTFLGNPTYALAVVLFSLLLFSGLGSMLVERVTDGERPRTLVRPVAALLGLLVVFGLATPRVIHAAAGATTPVRIATAVAILAPLALAMGMPFSIGMRAAARDEGAPTAFMWGINGAMSVVASVLGAVIAMFFGISVTFAAGFVAYGVAALALGLVLRRLRARDAVAAVPAAERAEVVEPATRDLTGVAPASRVTPASG